MLALLGVVGIAFGAWHFAKSKSADDPSKLVASNVDLYLEIHSVASLDSAINEITTAAGFPGSLAEFARTSPSKIAGAFADPEKSGLHRDRAIGYGMKFLADVPVAVAFIPVKEKSLLATHLGVDAKELEKAPLAVDGVFVQYVRGYIAVSDNATAITDALALKDNERGIVIPAEPAGSVIRVFVQPSLIEKAGKLMAALPMGPDKSVALLTQKIVSSVDRLDIALLWLPEGLRIQNNFRMKPDNLITPAFKAVEGPIPFLDLLPKAGLIMGARIDKEGTKKLGEEMVKAFESITGDTSLKALFQTSIELMGTEVASAVLGYNVAEPSQVRSITITRIPEGREAEFAESHALLRDASTKLGVIFMRKFGNSKATMTQTELPEEQYRGITIRGVEIATDLGLEPPPEADEKTLEMFEKMSHQKVTNRFAQVPGPNKKGELFVTAGGEELATITDQIDLLLGGEAPAAKTALSPAVTRVVELFGKGVFGIVIFDPFFLSGQATEIENTLGISGKVEGSDLVVEVILPREHLAGLPMKIMGIFARR